MSWNGWIPMPKVITGIKGLRNKRKAHWRKMRQAEEHHKLALQHKKEKRTDEFEQRYQGWDGNER